MASVIIRNKAKNRLAKILEQSFFDYGQTTMLRFLSELERIEKRLSEQPLSFPPEPLLRGMKREYRGCILKKNFKLIYYYRPRRQEVIISTIWDLRMSPERLVKEFLCYSTRVIKIKNAHLLGFSK